MAAGWIFCRVIDNFGDVGVSWRLSRLLHQEAKFPVVLLIDNLHALKNLVPECDVVASVQILHGITVVDWQEAVLAKQLQNLPKPQWVIETFGCDLPKSVLQIMQEKTKLWLNLEYLTAEPWAKDMHMLPSLQSNGLAKYFYFLGFEQETGGLLREADYGQKKWAFNHHEQDCFRASLGLPTKDADTHSIFLFAYPNQHWQTWFLAWQNWGQSIELLIACDAVWQEWEKFSQAQGLQAKGRSNIQAYRLPMVAQSQFDQLLWLSDWIFIRGEESFVRAQLSGKPFLWHIYQQENEVHLDKLAAFWQLWDGFLSPDLAKALAVVSLSINAATQVPDAQEIERAWQYLILHRAKWQEAAKKWSDGILSQASAVQKLASFIENNVK